MSTALILYLVKDPVTELLSYLSAYQIFGVHGAIASTQLYLLQLEHSAVAEFIIWIVNTGTKLIAAAGVIAVITVAVLIPILDGVGQFSHKKRK